MAEEAILEPNLPIVDPHHHLWDVDLPDHLPTAGHRFEEVIRNWPRYLLDELVADVRTGHNVIATVYVDCRSMYRADGPEAMRPIGEVEFANGVAAISASGKHGAFRACAGIVGRVDLTLGSAAAAVLEAELAASPRFRGIRHSASFDADPAVLGPLAHTPAGLYRSASFRAGFAELAPLGLSFDAWLLEPQLPDLIDLARAFPDQQIVLDHVGTPLGIASYEGRREERFAIWRDNIRSLAELPNVLVKLGGLPMPFCGFDLDGSENPSSETHADRWRPYIETCIEAFSPDRAMFESNFPVDKLNCDYATLWNAFKRITISYSEQEKAALYARTAIRAYRLDLPLEPAAATPS